MYMLYKIVQYHMYCIKLSLFVIKFKLLPYSWKYKVYIYKHMPCLQEKQTHHQLSLHII